MTEGTKTPFSRLRGLGLFSPDGFRRRRRCGGCAEGAGKSAKRLREAVEEYGVKLNIPPTSLWVDRCEGAGLEKTYIGLRPARYERCRAGSYMQGLTK